MDFRPTRNCQVMLLAALLLGIICCSAQMAPCQAGEITPYRVLQVDACPEMQPATATPYAYGWFGVTPRAHATRHFGFYKLYTEWSWR